MRLNSTIDTRRETNSIVAELREKSSIQPVYNICKKTGKKISISKGVEVSGISWKLWISRYRGGSSFLRDIRSLVSKKGISSLSEKQKDAAISAHKARHEQILKQKGGVTTRELNNKAKQVKHKKTKESKIGNS